ncbi:ankyrin repeat domain-containing protein [bacterium]|nr:ankyrin repeat domain-containing protein [bacterium]
MNKAYFNTYCLTFLLASTLVGCSKQQVMSDKNHTPQMSEEFYDAAVFADMAKLKTMIEADPSVVNSVDKWGFTALHGVAGEEHYDVVTFLVDRGANINAKNDEGIAPLHIAAWPKMVEMLVSHGADVNIRNKTGATPLMIHAREPDRYDVLRALLRAGADPTLSDDDGRTALEIATEFGDTEYAQLLSIKPAE